MAVATSTLLGRPLWYELMTTDMKAAESFYKTVVGWSTTPFDGAGQPYTMFTRGGDATVGGVMARPSVTGGRDVHLPRRKRAAGHSAGQH